MPPLHYLSMVIVLAQAGAARSAGEVDALPLGLPPADGPVVVHAGFHLQGINAIDEQAETFEFSGVLTLRWHDPRQAFDPAEAGVAERMFQGTFQFDELSPGWYPQVVLVNGAGPFDERGVLLRVQPDGGCTLIQAINGVAKSEFDLHRFPFDRQRLQAVFEVLGFDHEEVILQAEPESGIAAGVPHIPQWTIDGATSESRNRPAAHAGRLGSASSLVVTIDLARQSFFISRLVVLPLVVIVFLSFSVFWMHRSSLGDRISVSFIGILTGVAYQIVMSQILPRIAYVTLMNGFLNLSFLAMCATVVFNLVVGALDQRGRHELGDLIDRRCRWIFPLAYGSTILVTLVVTFTAF